MFYSECQCWWDYFGEKKLMKTFNLRINDDLQYMVNYFILVRDASCVIHRICSKHTHTFCWTKLWMIWIHFEKATVLTWPPMFGFEESSKIYGAQPSTAPKVQVPTRSQPGRITSSLCKPVTLACYFAHRGGYPSTWHTWAKGFLVIKSHLAAMTSPRSLGLLICSSLPDLFCVSKLNS